jgi:hypothetical protein
MAFLIVWLREAEVLGTTPWAGNLSSAKEHAIGHFPIQQQQHGATSVEIQDDNGSTRFRFPGGNDAART